MIGLGQPDGLSAELTLDQTGQSAALRLLGEGDELLRCFREGAVAGRLASSPPGIVVEFRTDDTSGTLELFLLPSLRRSETTLFA